MGMGRIAIDTGGILKLGQAEGCQGGILLSHDQGYLSERSPSVRAQQTGRPSCGDVDRSPNTEVFLSSTDTVSLDCNDTLAGRRLLFINGGHFLDISGGLLRT